MPCLAMDRLALTRTVSIAPALAGVSIITAAPQKRLRFRFERFRFENGLNRGVGMVSQTILNRIIARFLGQQRKRGSVLHSVTFPAVEAAGWVASSYPKIRPPSNFPPQSRHEPQKVILNHEAEACERCIAALTACLIG